MVPLKRGKLIVFEGIDGAGVSTQINMLCEYLKSRKKNVIVTKEPTNNLIGGLIRGFLTEEWKADPKTQQLLFAADRAQHVKKVILPALKRGYTVLCDRYVLSSLAYGSLELDKKWLKSVNSQFIEPDITLVLHVPPKISRQRIKASPFGLKLFEDEKKLSLVIKNYFEMSREYKNIYLINGMDEREKVHEEIVKKLEKHV